MIPRIRRAGLLLLFFGFGASAGCGDRSTERRAVIARRQAHVARRYTE